MHVAISTPSIRTRDGGAERWVAGWVDHLARAGHRVSTVSFGHVPAQDDVEHHVIDWIEDPFERIDAVDALITEIAPDRHYDTGIAGRSDVLHLHAGSSAHSIAAAERAGGRLPLSMRRPSPATQAVMASTRRQEKAQAQRSGWVVSMSLLAAKVQRRDLLVPATRQRLIPAGVDLAAATEATDGARDRLRGRWRIPDGGVAYLLVAHHPRLKGADVALAALRAAVDSGVDAYLVLAGARLDDWLLGEAGRHRCTDRLVMAGLVDPIADAFAASDVLLHPTRWDAFGSVVLEAMAAGLPVVTTEAAGVAEVIEDGRTGIVIGADPSPRQLTEAMRSLAGNAERSRIGTSAREEAARHPIDSTYQALEDVLCGPLPPHHAWQNDTRRRARSVRSVQRHDHPKVSIVMPVRDGEAHVAEAIESVLDQTFEDFDLHVVDDGSVDGTCGIVDGYAERDDRITLHRRDRAGIVAALNHGIEVSESVYVARMDADDVCKPERLARQITALDGNPNIGVLGTNYEVIGADGTPGAVSRLPISPFEIALTLTETNPIAHPTVMMRRSVLDALGGYREGFPLCEDYDLWLRASEVCDLANLEEPLLAYRRTGRDTRREQRFRSEVAVIEDHHLRQIRDERPSGRTHPAVVGVARRRLAYMIRHDLVTGEGVEALRATLLAVHLPGLSGRRRQATEPTSS